MKNPRLRQLVFWALIIDLSIIGKRLIMPGSNLITGALHIPGGVGTGFSLMFIAVAAEYEHFPWCCTAASMVQSGIQMIMGHMGSMGALTPVGYIVPGIVMDLTLRLIRARGRRERILAANTAAAVSAALTANLIVFQLRGIALLLYLSIAALFGALFALLGDSLVERINFSVSRRERDRNVNRRISILVMLALFTTTCVLSILHLTVGTSVAEQMLLIRAGESEVVLDMEAVQKKRINGTILNGKGETSVIDEEGYLMIDVLRSAGIEAGCVKTLTVTAEDEYSAGIGGDELTESNIYLSDSNNNGFRLIVFGDRDSKRNVKNVKIITVEENQK